MGHGFRLKTQQRVSVHVWYLEFWEEVSQRKSFPAGGGCSRGNMAGWLVQADTACDMISDVWDGAETVGWLIPKAVTKATVIVTCGRGRLQGRLRTLRLK